MATKYARKRCTKGKSCASTCISNAKTCRVELPSQTQSGVSKLRDFVKHHGAHTADHVAKGMVAWKVGKVLAPAVTGYLESQYGIPREASTHLTETVIQAVTATALEAKNIKSADKFVRKITSETAAAFLGKAAHAGAEHALAAEEARNLIQTTAPILAGKVTGITTAVAMNKVPTPAQLTQLIIRRSREDTNKLMEMFRPRQLAFSESTEAELLGDLAIVALIEAFGIG